MSFPFPYFFRIGDMGECSAVNAIKSVMKGKPSFCMRGIKISEHLGLQLKKLGIDYGKDEAEMDTITISCNGDKINVILGECKVSDTFFYILKTFFASEQNG